MVTAEVMVDYVYQYSKKMHTTENIKDHGIFSTSIALAFHAIGFVFESK